MTDKPTVSAGATGRRLLIRVIASMAVGAGLILAWTAAFESGWIKSWLDSTSLSQFLLLVVVGLPAALVVSTLLAGPVLWLLRVRPVWPIVLLGPVVLGVLLYLKVHEPILGWFSNRHHAEALLAAASYGLVGLITFKRT